jgi:hypothetical protein
METAFVKKNWVQCNVRFSTKRGKLFREEIIYPTTLAKCQTQEMHWQKLHNQEMHCRDSQCEEQHFMEQLCKEIRYAVVQCTGKNVKFCSLRNC